jgi:hypothetical protein
MSSFIKQNCLSTNNINSHETHLFWSKKGYQNTNLNKETMKN